jgi:hypothetical protein
MAQPAFERLDDGRLVRKDCLGPGVAQSSPNGSGSKQATGDLQREGNGLVLGR